MSGAQNDGGPAFPVTSRRKEKYCDEQGYGRTREVADLAGGMSLRDAFALHALPAVLSQVDVARESERKNAAWLAYQIAGDMLAERSK